MHHLRLAYVLTFSLTGLGCNSTPAQPTTPVPDLSNAPCNQLALPSASVTIQQGSGSPQAAAGGAIVVGTSAPTETTDYDVGDALVGQATGATMIVSAGTIES